MKWIIFFGALFIAACTQSQPATAPGRGSLSPSAPVNLTYQIDHVSADQSVHIDTAITTRLHVGTLLVEVAKQEGVSVLSESTQRIDLATATSPIVLQIQATPLGTGEHYLVLLLTVETEIGPMSRSFRIDVSTAERTSL